MDIFRDGVIKVKKFNLDDTVDRLEYEKILNDPTCTIDRDEFTYDKIGQAMITI